MMRGKSIGRWRASWEFSSFAERAEGRRKRAGRDDEEGRSGREIGEGVKPRGLLHGSSTGDWLVERKRAKMWRFAGMGGGGEVRGWTGGLEMEDRRGS